MHYLSEELKYLETANCSVPGPRNPFIAPSLCGYEPGSLPGPRTLLVLQGSAHRPPPKGVW